MSKTLIGVLTTFESLTDPRMERTRRHELFDLVVVALCAAIADSDGWGEIERFGLERLDWLRTYLRLESGIPSHDTFGRVFSRLDPAKAGRQQRIERERRTSTVVWQLEQLDGLGSSKHNDVGFVRHYFRPQWCSGEASQTRTYKLTAVPCASLGAIVLSDGVTTVVANTTYTLAQIQGMKFKAAANANGSGTFTFAVQDNGGMSNGGIDTSSNSIAINVTSVNDAPQGASKTVTGLEDSSYAFSATDFGFSDPNDSPASNLLAVKITALISLGTLKDNGVSVTLGQSASVSDIVSGLLL